MGSYPLPRLCRWDLGLTHEMLFNYEELMSPEAAPFDFEVTIMLDHKRLIINRAFDLILEELTLLALCKPQNY